MDNAINFIFMKDTPRTNQAGLFLSGFDIHDKKEPSLYRSGERPVNIPLSSFFVSV